MSQAHVQDLLSAACDGELSAAERRRFDRHLEGCPTCSAAYTEMSTMVDAVRELPAARMPRPVLLPSGPPVRARAARLGWLGSLRNPWAAGLAGAAVAAAVALAVVLPGRLTAGPAEPVAAGGAGLSAVPSAGSAHTCAGCAAPSAASVPEAGPEFSGTQCAPAPIPASAASAERPPAGFSNTDLQTRGATTVVVATQAAAYAPGQTVVIYARIVDDQTGQVEVPCTFLVPATAFSPSRPAGEPTSALEALPQAGLSIGGGATLAATIPGTAVAGSTYEVVVQVPSAAGGQPQQVTLSIQVT
ncbi:MAG TPA: zf-HC2 domain-containing protein [Candidatus Binatia bacterium]|nr:zf-HC2 domain-containing protein [Candidatus Binatia bacterium]